MTQTDIILLVQAILVIALGILVIRLWRNKNFYEEFKKFLGGSSDKNSD